MSRDVVMNKKYGYLIFDEESANLVGLFSSVDELADFIINNNSKVKEKQMLQKKSGLVKNIRENLIKAIIDSGDSYYSRRLCYLAIRVPIDPQEDDGIGDNSEFGKIMQDHGINC